MQGFWGEVHAKTPGLYQVPKLRNFNFCCCTVCFLGGGSRGGVEMMPGFWGEVLAKTPGLYEVGMTFLHFSNFSALGLDRDLGVSRGPPPGTPPMISCVDAQV